MFPIDEQPDFIKDLNTLEKIPSELAIQGKTKNLDRLKEFSSIEKLWVFGVNQAIGKEQMTNYTENRKYMIENKLHLEVE